MDRSPTNLVVCTCLPSGSPGALDAAVAATAVAAAVAGSTGSSDRDGRGRDGGRLAPLVFDARAGAPRRRRTVLASPAARRTESALDGCEGFRAAARGRICFAIPDGRAPERSATERSVPVSGHARLRALTGLLDGELPLPLVFAVCDGADFRSALRLAASAERGVLLLGSASDRALLSLLCFELTRARIPVKVWNRPIGLVPARRALAGLEPGGETGARGARVATRLVPDRDRGDRRRGHRSQPPIPVSVEAGQALPALLGLLLLAVVFALAVVAIGAATTAKGRLQGSADLAALSAARSMHDDFERLFLPSTLPDGAPNPMHLSKHEYLLRARSAALHAAERNEVDVAESRVRFPDGSSFAPMRVRVRLGGEITVGDRASGERGAAVAEARVTPFAAAPATGGSDPVIATGGGYSGPLEHRQGTPMRPDVAVAFDRMAIAAQADGIVLVINSGFRSDAEQQALWEANPDPQWVAPPGTSLHRCGTELDLGPSSAYGWLAANARRFGFEQRYAWEAWHYGYVEGPEPCSAEGDHVNAGAPGGDGRGSGGQGLPAFVPARYRGPLLAAAAASDVSAALLAAQLMAESNFNPQAVSSAGALGIAQFMPATAAAYGLEDPFDPVASIRAQARMMAELLGQFGSAELALAAYNAGPGAVASCDCIPPYPETQAYVARVLGLLRGAGGLSALAPSSLEVSLVD